MKKLRQRETIYPITEHGQLHHSVTQAKDLGIVLDSSFSYIFVLFVTTLWQFSLAMHFSSLPWTSEKGQSPCIYLFLSSQWVRPPTRPSTFLDILYRRAALYLPFTSLSFLYYTTLLFSIAYIINFTCLSNLFLWNRDQQTVAYRQIQPLVCFCMAHELRLGFTFLSSWKKSKAEYFRMHEDYMKFRFHHLYIKSGTKQYPFIYLLSMATFVNEIKAELRSCYSDCVAGKAENIYHM